MNFHVVVVYTRFIFSPSPSSIFHGNIKYHILAIPFEGSFPFNPFFCCLVCFLADIVHWTQRNTMHRKWIAINSKSITRGILLLLLSLLQLWLQVQFERDHLISVLTVLEHFDWRCLLMFLDLTSRGFVTERWLLTYSGERSRDPSPFMKGLRQS